MRISLDIPDSVLLPYVVVVVKVYPMTAQRWGPLGSVDAGILHLRPMTRFPEHGRSELD